MVNEAPRLQIYTNCMREIKERIAVTDQFLTEWREQNVATAFACEMAALQLRKIYELVAFSAISADLEKYSVFRRRFSKDWDFNAIIKTISNFNPNFLPKPTRRVPSQVEGVNWHLEERPEAELSKEELIFRHGYLHKFLHASNPFGKQHEPREALLRFDTWVREIAQLLSQHRYVIGPMQQGYIVELNGHGEEVTAFRYDLAE